jgi:DNA-binding GntR family transcriptional regulator
MEKAKPTFVKASEQVRAALEAAIRDGSLPPGEAIDEADWASRHRVSRTPVREALILLQAEGLVSSLPRGGMVVAKMDLRQLLALWELLAELEGLAARLACQRMTPEELAQLQACHRGSEAVMQAEDLAGWQDYNLRFHEIIYGATRNPYLRQEVLRIRSRTGFYRRHAFGALGRLQTSFEQHELIVQALRVRDADAAVFSMRDHMRPGRDAKTLNDFILNLPTDLLATA